jgi:hypothetical protein
MVERHICRQLDVSDYFIKLEVLTEAFQCAQRSRVVCVSIGTSALVYVIINVLL